MNTNPFTVWADFSDSNIEDKQLKYWPTVLPHKGDFIHHSNFIDPQDLTDKELAELSQTLWVVDYIVWDRTNAGEVRATITLTSAG